MTVDQETGPGCPVAAGGNRLEWRQLPPAIRGGIEARLGATVTAAASQAGGFSPGLAARLVLSDGRRVFVKAISADQAPSGPSVYRREARVAAALPSTVPAPRLLWTLDEDGWVVLALEDIEGRPPSVPWRAAELRQVLDSLVGLAEVLTPAPVPVARMVDVLDEDFRAWRRFAGQEDIGLPEGSTVHRPAAAVPAVDRLRELSPWAAANRERLAEREAGWAALADGDSLLHGDLRADNLLLTPDGRVVVVDWPWACIGAPWVDLVFMLPSIAMQGGADPETIVREHPLLRQVPADAVTAVLTALAGFFVESALQPPPPGLPTVRAFQRGQGLAVLDLIRRRID